MNCKRAASQTRVGYRRPAKSRLLPICSRFAELYRAYDAEPAVDRKRTRPGHGIRIPPLCAKAANARGLCRPASLRGAARRHRCGQEDPGHRQGTTAQLPTIQSVWSRRVTALSECNIVPIVVDTRPEKLERALRLGLSTRRAPQRIQSPIDRRKIQIAQRSAAKSNPQRTGKCGP